MDWPVLDSLETYDCFKKNRKRGANSDFSLW